MAAEINRAMGVPIPTPRLTLTRPHSRWEPPLEESRQKGMPLFLKLFHGQAIRRRNDQFFHIVFSMLSDVTKNIHFRRQAAVSIVLSIAVIFFNMLKCR